MAGAPKKSVTRGSLGRGSLRSRRGFWSSYINVQCHLRDCLYPLQVMGKLLNRKCVRCPQKEQHLHMGRQASPSLRKIMPTGVVTERHTHVNQLSLPVDTGHLAQGEVNQLGMELTISRILELTYFSSQLKMLGLICYSVLLLQHLCKPLIKAGVQCKGTHFIFYQIYCKKCIRHLQLKVAELQQLVLVSRILQLLLQTVVFCFHFLYLTEIS